MSKITVDENGNLKNIAENSKEIQGEILSAIEAAFKVVTEKYKEISIVDGIGALECFKCSLLLNTIKGGK